MVHKAESFKYRGALSTSCARMLKLLILQDFLDKACSDHNLNSLDLRLGCQNFIGKNRHFLGLA
jgi:hypothetical protein